MQRSTGTTSIPASQYRTPSSRVSTAASGTSFSTKHSSPRFHRRAPLSKNGEPTTTRSGRILASAGWRQPFTQLNSDRNGPRRQGLWGATRLGPLLRPIRWGKSPPRLNSPLDESWGQRHADYFSSSKKGEGRPLPFSGVKL